MNRINFKALLRQAREDAKLIKTSKKKYKINCKKLIQTYSDKNYSFKLSFINLVIGYL